MIRYIRRPESYLKTMDGQIELGNRLHYQDYAIHLTLFSPAQVAEIPQYVEGFGVTSFKVYMNMKGRLGGGVLMDLLPDSGHAEPRDVDYSAAHLYDVFSKMAQIPAPLRLNVHCEDAEMLQRGIQQIRQTGLTGLHAWHKACSDLSEALAIEQAAFFSRETGVPLYFPHIGSCAAIMALREVQSRGTDFVAETCPHYLTQTTDCAAGVKAKIMPPIRTTEHQKMVWQALQEGLIATIGSDHVAYTLDEKNPVDIWTARPAFAGTGLILPLLLSEGVARYRLSLRQLARITSYNCARIFGLYPRKGTLLPGSDADFVVVDPERTWRVDGGNLLTYSDFCIYEGMAMKGAVDCVFVRGVKMFENGKLLGPKGHGHYLRRD
jgi:dihydropyrimidinase